jgi:hypothetical protein
MTEHPIRHILSLSGGKDSAALSVFMRDKIENLEYVFSDTGDELPETYSYLEKMEAYLGKPVIRLNPDRPFDHYLQLYNGVLPDARTRWCTRKLKIEPFEKFVGNDPVVNYIGIRADESHRKGYISTKPNITAKYPFIEAGIVKADVFRILEESGLGLPEYYSWRSRSGCYFCFFQRRIEWVGLLENHPDLYKQAMAYEKENLETGEFYSWVQNERLKELHKTERIEQIKKEESKRAEFGKKSQKINLTLSDVFNSESDQDGNDSCLICHL